MTLSKPSLVLLPLLLALSNPASALQILDARDGETVLGKLSRKEVTRITFERGRIRKVTGNAGEFVLEKDEEKGQIFIRPASPDSTKPINLFIKTCDDDLRDPNAPPQTMRLWREPEGNEIPINPDTGEGHIVVQFDKKGTYYIGFGLTDGEIIRMGSIVLDITQMNKPPVLGGCRMLQ